MSMIRVKGNTMKAYRRNDYKTGDSKVGLR